MLIKFKKVLQYRFTARRRLPPISLRLFLNSIFIRESFMIEHFEGEPIRLEPHDAWIDLNTRPGCKYAPVVVSKKPTVGAISSMQEVLRRRIETCRKLGLLHKSSGGVSWFSFIRGTPKHEPHLNSNTVPAIVISGGSGKKIAVDLDKDYSLAWHPKNMLNTPIYLLVHELDYLSYESALRVVLGRFRNLHLIGWNGGGMTGFGAARAAALAFADSLLYRPTRIMMLDQDVVQTEATRHNNPSVRNKVESMHIDTRKPIIGYGVGYPTRVAVPKPFQNDRSGPKMAEPKIADFNSPAQQFVSILAPFRTRKGDGMYPPYMVAGGEDMLMGMQLSLNQGDRNVALLEGMIMKKELKGEVDKPNAYWSTARVATLKALFEVEQYTRVTFGDASMRLGELMGRFVNNNWIKSHPSDDSYNVSACVIERIILRLHKEGSFPGEESGTVLNRW
jgi:hypothetical protein